MEVVGVDVVFFFQAEDGIRDYKVTGVQTCALPISSSPECMESAFGLGLTSDSFPSRPDRSCAKLIDRYLLNQELRTLELCLNRCRGVGSLLDRFEFSEPFIANPRLAHLVRSFADE